MKDLTKYFIDLRKCTEEERKHIFSLLPDPVKKGDYQIDSENYFLHFNNVFSYPRWYVDFEYYNKTELTYPEFIRLFEGGEGENNGWIKVTESLPNRNDVVLVLTDYGKMDVCIFKEKDYWLNDMRQQHSNGGVVAWMPLPEPPKF